MTTLPTIAVAIPVMWASRHRCAPTRNAAGSEWSTAPPHVTPARTHAALVRPRARRPPPAPRTRRAPGSGRNRQNTPRRPRTRAGVQRRAPHPRTDDRLWQTEHQQRRERRGDERDERDTADVPDPEDAGDRDSGEERERLREQHAGERPRASTHQASPRHRSIGPSSSRRGAGAPPFSAVGLTPHYFAGVTKHAARQGRRATLRDVRLRLAASAATKRRPGSEQHDAPRHDEPDVETRERQRALRRGRGGRLLLPPSPTPSPAARPPCRRRSKPDEPPGKRRRRQHEAVAPIASTAVAVFTPSPLFDQLTRPRTPLEAAPRTPG